MDYHTQYALFQRNSYGIIQCLHGIQGLQMQAAESRILPFFKSHLDPLLQHFNPAFTNRTLQRTNEILLTRYASQIATQGIWHLQKTIAKLITEIIYLDLHQSDKSFIMRGAITKAKSHFGRKLQYTTIKEFTSCIHNLWENFKCNNSMLDYWREQHGPDWINIEFRDYTPNVTNSPLGKRPISTSAPRPSSYQITEQTSIPREYGNFHLSPNKTRKTKRTSSHNKRRLLDYSPNLPSHPEHLHNQHSNAVNIQTTTRHSTHTIREAPTSKTTSDHYCHKLKGDYESYIRRYPQQKIVVTLIYNYIEKCVESDYYKEKLFNCMLKLFNDNSLSVLLDFSGDTMFSTTDLSKLTFKHVSAGVQTDIIRLLNNLPGIKPTSTETILPIPTNTRKISRPTTPPSLDSSSQLVLSPIPHLLPNPQYLITDREHLLRYTGYIPTSNLHITTTPGTPLSREVIPSTPFNPTDIDTTDTDTQNTSTEDLNLLLLDDFVLNYDFGTPQRDVILNTLKLLLIDQTITNRNLEITIDDNEMINFNKRGNRVHFYFPLTNAVFKTDEVFDDTLTLLRALPGLSFDSEVVYSKNTEDEPLPLFGPPPFQEPPNTEWPDSWTTSVSWGDTPSPIPISDRNPKANSSKRITEEQLGTTLDFLL